MRMAKWCRKVSRLDGGIVAKEKEGGSLNTSSNLKHVKWEKGLHGGSGTGLTEEVSGPCSLGHRQMDFFVAIEFIAAVSFKASNEKRVSTASSP